MKIQESHGPTSPPAADAYAYCNECMLSVSCPLRFNFWYFLIPIFKANDYLRGEGQTIFQEGFVPGPGLAAALEVTYLILNLPTLW